MKRLFKITKIKIFLSLLALAPLAHGASVGLIQNLRGNSFVTTAQRLVPTTVGQSVTDFSEVMTEEGASVTIALSHDQVLHLAGSTQVRFLNKMIELKRGYLWLQSPRSGGVARIQTANADFRFERGEGIYSYDSAQSKSQILVLSGELTVANINLPENFTVLRDGEFSFVSSDYEDGRPRPPTRIGSTSFEKLMTLFQGVEPIAPHSYEAPAGGRSIASVETEKTDRVKPGKIIYIEDRTQERKKLQELELLNYHNRQLVKMAKPNKAPKKWKPSYKKASGVAVHIFGAGPRPSGRTPASVAPAESVAPRRSPASLGRMAPVIQDTDFNSSLMEQYKKQKRHSKEVNSLIKELESVDQDFNEAY